MPVLHGSSPKPRSCGLQTVPGAQENAALAPSECRIAQPSNGAVLLAAASLQTALCVNGKTSIPSYLPATSPALELLPRLESAAGPAPPIAQSQSCSCHVPPRCKGCKSRERGLRFPVVQRGQTYYLLGQISLHCAHHGKYQGWSCKGQMRSEWR